MALLSDPLFDDIPEYRNILLQQDRKESPYQLCMPRYFHSVYLLHGRISLHFPKCGDCIDSCCSNFGSFCSANLADIFRKTAFQSLNYS